LRLAPGRRRGPGNPWHERRSGGDHRPRVAGLAAGRVSNKTPMRSPASASGGIASPALVRGYAQDLLGLGQRVERFLMLASLVQRLAFGAVLLYLIHLRRRQLRVLG